ncbi:hypothetical protein [Streptomyces collinus]|uniref:hypothetical protein n=1 Tax=Streptomyces collinus TaxID=42684 RepID=UPI0037D37813
MTTTSRTALAALITAGAVVGTTLATATPASALSYKCSTSKQSIDDAGFYGAMPDNWDFTIKICAARSGSYVYSYAKLTWDGPVYSDGNILDSAAFRLYVKKSVSGPDPVKTYKPFGIESKLEAHDSVGNHNGTYTTPKARYKIGSGKALSDGALKLNWDFDGAGVRTYGFSASPRV